LSVETPVYYDDGESLMGVFFENEHRMYIEYEEIPKDFVNALIAAEDKNFFSHPGIDPLAILRAFYVNFRANKIVQGGSTLSQQTAKNVFQREGRTFRAKFNELIQTLKLEAHYPKKEIIEFFSNQFYVSGTGRGLGIAAKYFFDKSVDQLTLLECAFIAGSVRAPNKYNPLIQADPEKERKTLCRAIERKNYVLANMFYLRMISLSQYRELVRASIPFKKGKIYYQLNVIMDYIREQLQSEPFQEILNEQGISNIATSGIKIYTTINKDLQEANLRIMRKNLSQIETLVTGYDRETVQLRYAQLNIPEGKKIEIGQFVFGKVEKITKGDRPSILVKVENSFCKVDYKGLINLVVPFKKSKSGVWADPSPRDMEKFLAQIEEGDLVYAFVREKSLEEDLFLLDLEQKSRLEGALVILNEGKIVSMVGGAENSNFNRAVSGKRQLGSIFKPLLFTAALQLGWNILDPLENKRDVFVFQDQFYFPRPDHESPHPKVSLAWAGVKSENVASVWLLYHLFDQLSFTQFKKVAETVDLSPRENENYRDFQRRVRDSWGIIVTGKSLKESAFKAAQEEIVTDLIFSGSIRESQSLKFLKYGVGFDNYREFFLEEKESLEIEEEIDPSLLQEYDIREDILKKHFLRYSSLNSQMLQEWEYLKDAFLFFGFDSDKVADNMLANFYTGFVDGEKVIAYGEDLSEEEFVPLTYYQAYNLFKREARKELPFSSPYHEDVLIEGEIHSSVLSDLNQSLEKELTKLKKHAPYELISLWKNREYRILVGLLYMVRLCETMGIETPLKPVLSFPLGPNAVSLLEISQAYSTFLEGKRYNDNRSLYNNSSIVIDRIVDCRGEEIYRFVPHERQVLDSHVVNMVTEILKNVVIYGTGRKAKNRVKMELEFGVKGRRLVINLPTLGKTGTANEYSNSSYIGFVPAFLEGSTELALQNAFVVAAYVGYDDNTPMENDHVRIFGASGALPIWIDVANEIVQNSVFQRSIDPVDFAFLPQNRLSLSQPADTILVPIDKGSGLPLSLDAYLEEEKPAVTLYSYGQRRGSFFKPRRFFSPLNSNRLTHASQ